MDVMPSGGVKIQKVGAIYTRTLEEGGAIYFENGVDFLRYISTLHAMLTDAHELQLIIQWFNQWS
jgi:hypothetical protein